MATKNLGQVAGLFIGTTAPENTTLIWFDSTPSLKCHKVFNGTEWVILDSSSITNITYSELKTAAQAGNISVGQWFKLTDKNNALALAITTTKIQYVDNVGNMVIDDLGGSEEGIQYHVTQNNILIDDIRGVFDTVSKQVKFTFEEETPNKDEDYVLGSGIRNGVLKLLKFKVSKWLSPKTGNTISWDNGLFLNFSQRFSEHLDTPEGAVKTSTHEAAITKVEKDIAAVAADVASIQSQVAQDITDGLSDAAVYEKKLPDEPQLNPSNLIDIHAGDTLTVLIGKIQRWINSFKVATGMKMPSYYTLSGRKDGEEVNYADSVYSAITKLDYQIHKFQAYNGKGTDSIILAGDYVPQIRTITPGTTDLTSVLENLAQTCVNLQNTINVFKESSTFVPNGAILIFNKVPNFANIVGGDASSNWSGGLRPGKGWFPCGCFIQTADTEEKKKWDDFYGTGALSWSIENISGNNYYRISHFRGFSIPNLTDRFILGYVPGDSKKDINDTGGEAEHKLSVNEMPKHMHLQDHDELNSTTTVENKSRTITGGSHQHTINNLGENYYDPGGSTGYNHPRIGSSKTESASHTHSLTEYSRGGSQPHNNMPPFIIQSFIIKLGY